MNKIKPLIAYAVISAKNPEIKVSEIYDKEQIKEIKLSKGEKIIRVKIQAYEMDRRKT